MTSSSAADRSTPVAPLGTPPATGEHRTLTERDADLSDDGLYRYSLTRSWGHEDDPRICWVMLNPSTADALVDDPTIRRCIGFSAAWGFGSLVVVNLFALRSTDPRGLLTAAVDPIGPRNDAAIRAGAKQSNVTIAAWGTKGGLRHRNAEVIRLVVGDCMETLHALAITKDGHPKHPLYVRADTKPVLYRPAEPTYIGRSAQ